MGKSECVHKKSRGLLSPEYARLESTRVFLFSVGQRGPARGFLWDLSSGGVLFILLFNPIELLRLWLEGVLVSGS